MEDILKKDYAEIERKVVVVEKYISICQPCVYKNPGCTMYTTYSIKSKCKLCGRNDYLAIVKLPEKNP